MASTDELVRPGGAPYGADDVAEDVAEPDEQVTEEDEELINVGDLARDPNFRRFQSVYDQKLARLQQELEQARQQTIPEAPAIPPPDQGEVLAAETARDRYLDLYDQLQDAEADDPESAKAQRLRQRLDRAGMLLKQADTIVFAKQVGLDPNDKGLQDYLAQNASRITNSDQLDAHIAKYAATLTANARQRLASAQKQLETQQAQAQKQQAAVQRHEAGANALPAAVPKGASAALAKARQEYGNLAGVVGVNAAMRRMQLLRDHPELAG